MNIVDTLVFSTRTLLLRQDARADPETVETLQRRRLRRLVRLAMQRSPFYRARYRGLNPDRCTLADLPPTNKGEVMAHFDEVITDPAVRRADVERFLDAPELNLGRYFQGRYVVCHSSGTQGQPMIVVQPRRLLELLFGLHMTRGNVTTPTNPVEVVRRAFDPARLAVVTVKRGFYPSATAFEYFPPAVRAYVQLLRLSQTDPYVVDQLNDFRPNALTGYASVLDALALEVCAGRLRLAPELRQVVNNSEPLTPAARERIRLAFGVPVLDNYAACECLFLSNGCPTHSGAHVNADWAILEVVDDMGRPVPPGTTGRKVLVTNLANTVQPLIRYEINDLVTMAATACACGSRLPRVEKVEGRQSDLFWVQDGAAYRPLPPHVFKNAFDDLREVREWKAVQFERNRVRVYLEMLPGTLLDQNRARRVLNRELDLCGLRGVVQVDLEVSPQLRADPATGKFRRSVSLVGPPERANVPHEERTAALVG